MTERNQEKSQYIQSFGWDIEAFIFRTYISIAWPVNHRGPDMWTQLSALKNEDLSRNATVHNVLILGRLGEET